MSVSLKLGLLFPANGIHSRYRLRPSRRGTSRFTFAGSASGRTGSTPTSRRSTGSSRAATRRSSRASTGSGGESEPNVRISRPFFSRDGHFLFRTMMRKYTTVKKNISMYNRHRVVDRDPSNPDFQTISSMYQVLRDACWLKLISSGNVLYCDVFMD